MAAVRPVFLALLLLCLMQQFVRPVPITVPSSSSAVADADNQDETDEQATSTMAAKLRHHYKKKRDLKMGLLEEMDGCSEEAYLASRRNSLRIFVMTVAVPRHLFFDSYTCDSCLNVTDYASKESFFFRVSGFCEDCDSDEIKTTRGSRTLFGAINRSRRLHYTFTTCPWSRVTRQVMFEIVGSSMMRIFYTGAEFPIMEMMVKTPKSRVLIKTKRSSEGYFYLDGTHGFVKSIKQGAQIHTYTRDIYGKIQIRNTIFENSTWGEWSTLTRPLIPSEEGSKRPILTSPKTVEEETSTSHFDETTNATDEMNNAININDFLDDLETTPEVHSRIPNSSEAPVKPTIADQIAEFTEQFNASSETSLNKPDIGMGRVDTGTATVPGQGPQSNESIGAHTNSNEHLTSTVTVHVSDKEQQHDNDTGSELSPMTTVNPQSTTMNSELVESNHHANTTASQLLFDTTKDHESNTEDNATISLGNKTTSDPTSRHPNKPHSEDLEHSSEQTESPESGDNLVTESQPSKTESSESGDTHSVAIDPIPSTTKPSGLTDTMLTDPIPGETEPNDTATDQTPRTTALSDLGDIVTIDPIPSLTKSSNSGDDVATEPFQEMTESPEPDDIVVTDQVPNSNKTSDSIETMVTEPMPNNTESSEPNATLVIDPVPSTTESSNSFEIMVLPGSTESPNWGDTMVTEPLPGKPDSSDSGEIMVTEPFSETTESHEPDDIVVTNPVQFSTKPSNSSDIMVTEPMPETTESPGSSDALVTEQSPDKTEYPGGILFPALSEEIFIDPVRTTTELSNSLEIMVSPGITETPDWGDTVRTDPSTGKPDSSEPGGNLVIDPIPSTTESPSSSDALVTERPPDKTEYPGGTLFPALSEEIFIDPVRTTTESFASFPGIEWESSSFPSWQPKESSTKTDSPSSSPTKQPMTESTFSSLADKSKSTKDWQWPFTLKPRPTQQPPNSVTEPASPFPLSKRWSKSTKSWLNSGRPSTSSSKPSTENWWNWGLSSSMAASTPSSTDESSAPSQNGGLLTPPSGPPPPPSSNTESTSTSFPPSSSTSFSPIWDDFQWEDPAPVFRPRPRPIASSNSNDGFASPDWSHGGSTVSTLEPWGAAFSSLSPILEGDNLYDGNDNSYDNDAFNMPIRRGMLRRIIRKSTETSVPDGVKNDSDNDNDAFNLPIRNDMLRRIIRKSTETSVPDGVKNDSDNETEEGEYEEDGIINETEMQLANADEGGTNNSTNAKLGLQQRVIFNSVALPASSTSLFVISTLVSFILVAFL